jgi:hypothetical protein
MPPPHRNPPIDKKVVRIMDDPVQDSIGQGFFADLFMPSSRGKLSYSPKTGPGLKVIS